MTGQTKLVFPRLAGFYEAMTPIAVTLIRILVGIMFLVHVSGKFKIGADAIASNIMGKNGLEPALLFTYVTMALELVGGICLVVGLLTRFFSAALAIEMLIALVFVHLPKGYAAGGGGYELARRVSSLRYAAAGAIQRIG
jgi:putative oxidoreductase